MGARSFAYNDSLQLESETISGLYDEVITRTYETGDIKGRYNGFKLASNYTVTYGYDGSGRFESLAWNVAGQSQTTTYDYLADSNLLQNLNTGNGLQVSFAYEPHRNLRTRVNNAFGASLISQYDYTYDNIGRRETVVNSGQAFAAAGTAYNRFGYNDRDELIRSDRYPGTDILNTNNPVTEEQRSYLYDPIGNRKQVEEWDEVGSELITRSYATNGLNQYTQTSTAGNNGRDFTYDDDGNLATLTEGNATFEYVYNAENRLTQIAPTTPAIGDKKVEYRYDFLGRRVEKKAYRWVGGNWTTEYEKRFVYDGWNLIVELTDDGTSQRKFYVWGLDVSQSIKGAGGVGGLLAGVEESTAAVFQYTYDGNGNVCQLLSAADGAITAHYVYDPFGKEIVASGPQAETNSFRFSTKYLETEFLIYYYGYRYYSPDLGRWLSRDPIEGYSSINLYNFVNNNAYLYIDSFGLLPTYQCPRNKSERSNAFVYVSNFVKGIYSIAEDLLYYGPKRTIQGLGLSGSYRVGDIGIENERFAYFVISFTDQIINKREQLYNLVEETVDYFFEYLPECAQKYFIEKSQAEVFKAEGYLAGRYIGGPYLAKKLASFIIGKIAATSAYKVANTKIVGASAASATLIGYPIGLSILQGTLQRATEASNRLKQEDPELYEKFRRKDLDLGYFLAEEGIKPYLDELRKIKNLAKHNRDLVKSIARQKYCCKKGEKWQPR